jgi:hypothetical protein
MTRMLRRLLPPVAMAAMVVAATSPSWRLLLLGESPAELRQLLCSALQPKRECGPPVPARPQGHRTGLHRCRCNDLPACRAPQCNRCVAGADAAGL